MSPQRESNYRSFSDDERAIRDAAAVGASPVDLPAKPRIVLPTPGAWAWPSSPVELRVLFTNPDSVAAPVSSYGDTIVTPTSVTCVAMDPTNAEQPLTTTVNQDGSWSATVLPTLSGTWWFRFACSGGFAASIQSFFQVRQSRT